ncbi:hypothetical protein TI05_17760 [Achromatium sp. WMS3]|nr:hypothetical protein TI05_17760 [Achromatium sp. WMS3]
MIFKDNFCHVLRVIPKIHKRNQKAPTTVSDNIVTYGGVQFLRYEEEYEVRKGKIGTLAFYTKRDSGESGMSVKSLANGCGIALKSLQELLEEKNIEFFWRVRANKAILLLTLWFPKQKWVRANQQTSTLSRHLQSM